MAENVINKFIKNDITVLVSCYDNLCKATNAIINRQHSEILKLSIGGSHIFILSCHVGIKKYKRQQVDIGILF
jgi:hypothetical protein